MHKHWLYFIGLAVALQTIRLEATTLEKTTPLFSGKFYRGQTDERIVNDSKKEDLLSAIIKISSSTTTIKDAKPNDIPNFENPEKKFDVSRLK